MPLPEMFVLPKWCRRGRIHHPEVMGSMATSLVEVIDIAAGEAPNLLTIPLELRFQIFSYLVSNDTISSGRNNDDDEGLTTASCPIPSILLVNRQLNAQAFSYIYHTNTVTLTIDSRYINFLGVKHGRFAEWYLREDLSEDIDPPSPLPLHFPYSCMKEFVIEVQLKPTGERDRDPQREAYEVRGILRRLCGRLLSQKIHLRLLRIRFPVPEREIKIDEETESGRSSTDHWDELWDSNNPGHADQAFLKQAFPFGWRNGWDFARVPFEHPNCPSTFAWVLSVFALCPAMANECMIELPESLQGKDAMREVADRYEKILDGRLTTEDDDFLEEDQWALSHPHMYPYCKKKSCKICVRKGVEQAELNRTLIMKQSVKERLLHAWALKDSIIAPGVEYWESPMQNWRDDDLTSWWWEKARKWIMDAMEEKWGLQEGRNLYHRFFWVLEKLRRNYSKRQIKAWEDSVDDLPKLREYYKRRIHWQWDTLAGFKARETVRQFVLYGTELPPEPMED